MNREMHFEAKIRVEELSEGVFLATSDEFPGLVAQGSTVAGTVEIAGEVASKLIEARRERDGVPDLPTTDAKRDHTIIVSATSKLPI